MKKSMLIFLALILFTGCIYPEKKDSNFIEKSQMEERAGSTLEEQGYTEEEKSIIQNSLTEEQMQFVLSKDYEKNILLGLINETYFINTNVERYLNYYMKNNVKSFSDIVKDVNSNIDIEFYIDQVPTDTSQGILMIANKHYALSEDFEGLEVVSVDAKYAYYDRQYTLNKEAYEHFEKMWSAAKKVGLDFGIYSAYRSYSTQTGLYAGYVERDGKELADTYSARPGNSEHQTGLAVDLKSRTMTTDYFETTKEYEWLQKNSYKYGFIERYELGQEYITGYQYEPWHYRYCGLECATFIHENHITFEEYYEYYVKDR